MTFLYVHLWDFQVELPGCKGIWTVYHKNTRGSGADSSRMVPDDDEYHAYLIISLEARTMVIYRFLFLNFKEKTAQVGT